jgi:chromosome segregation ATPase
MDFSKFDLLENKISALIEKVAEGETVKAELTQKLTEAENNLQVIQKKLADSEDALTKIKADLDKSQKDNETLSEIQESAKLKIDDLIKDRQLALSRVEALLDKLGSLS